MKHFMIMESIFFLPEQAVSSEGLGPVGVLGVSFIEGVVSVSIYGKDGGVFGSRETM